MAEKNRNPAARNVEAIARDNQLNSPLLRLPAELRNRIYFFTFDTNEIVLEPPSYRDPPYLPPMPYPLGLAQSCTQFRCETLPYFWKTAVFQLGYSLFNRNLAYHESLCQTALDQIQIIRLPQCAMRRVSSRRYQSSWFKNCTALRKVLISWPFMEDTERAETALRRIFGKDMEICFLTD